MKPKPKPRRPQPAAPNFWGWHPGLPDPHWAGRIWFRTDRGTVTLFPVMYLGTTLYLVVYPLSSRVCEFTHDDLSNAKVFGPNPRWARCEPPEEGGV